MMENASVPYALPACPYVGMQDDPATSYAYPTSGNACSYCYPPASPLVEHQDRYCLSEAYRDCPVIAGPPGGAFPLAHFYRGRARRWSLPKLLALALGLAALAYAGWLAFQGLG